MGKTCFMLLGDKKPRAVRYFSERYGVPITRPLEGGMEDFDTVLLSLHSWRDFYTLSELAHLKRKGQEWIAGGGACTTPTAIAWLVDYIFVGSAWRSFPRILQGERELPGMLDCANPKPVDYQDEPLPDHHISKREVMLSKGCRRRCLFCVNPWREEYAEQDRGVVRSLIESAEQSGLDLISNSGDDVTYYRDVRCWLDANEKTNTVISNSVSGLTDDVVRDRRREILLGIEGMSERLRRVVNKPIARDQLNEAVDRTLRAGTQVRTVYQFNLPSETMVDFAELLSDVHYLRKRHKSGSWSIPFIPNQPTAHTPMQWCQPRYSLEMVAAIMKLRRMHFGSCNDGVAIYVPAPLYPAKWLAQVIAEWIPITPRVARVERKLPDNEPIDSLVDRLRSEAVRIPAAMLTEREGTTKFPWDVVRMQTPKAGLWKHYARMRRRLLQ